MIDDPGDFGAVPAADPIDLLDKRPVLPCQPGVQAEALVEALEVGHGHAGIEVVGARGEKIAAAFGRLAGHERVDLRVEERPAQALEQRFDRFPWSHGEARAVPGRLPGCVQQLLERALQHELARADRPVRSRIDPEQLRVAANLGEDWRRRGRVQGPRAGMVDENLLDDLAHVERVSVPLIVVDISAGERRLVQVPRQDLLLRRQGLEAIRVILHHRRVVDLFEEESSSHQICIVS